MNIITPDGARPAARVLIVNKQNCVLYLHARQLKTGSGFWVLPGGGLEPGESFEIAAIREVQEETGIEIALDACLWTRHHTFEWNGLEQNQFEVFFLAHTTQTKVRGQKPDSYVFGYKWWSLREIQKTSELFAPRDIARLLAPVLEGDLPSTPFDCGV